MIAYKIQIVIDEEHEEKFEDITKDIYNHIERIDGITEVHGDPESYFEYNEDINFEEEEDDKTEQEIVDIIKGNEIVTFSLPGMGHQELPTERIKFLIDAWEKQKAKKPKYEYVLINNRDEGEIRTCSSCDNIYLQNEQKYCPDCGQKLDWREE